jgi:hypothetical protein
MTSPSSSQPTRRSFLKLGAVTVAVLGVGGWFASYLTDKGARAVLGKAVYLDAQSQTMIAKLADALLDGILPVDAGARAQAIMRVVMTVDQALATLPPPVQKETQDLFTVLGLAPARALLLGQWTGWAQVSRADVVATFERLRSSSIGLRRVIFMGLRDLVVSCFYASPDIWALVGYPGPLVRGPGVDV